VTVNTPWAGGVVAARRRRFGYVRRLPSGRYQASYLAPDGLRRTAPGTFATKRAAEQWLSTTEAELLRGDWLDPDDQRETLLAFGERWIKERQGLSPRTRDLYGWLFGKYIGPRIGSKSLGELDSAGIRAWHARLLDDGVSATMTAKAYRLLRAILMTAVDDAIIARNPCRIRGAGTERPAERPVLTVPQVLDLAAAMPAAYNVMVLVTTFGSLRWGEVTALRRRDIDSLTGAVHVHSAFSRRYSGEIIRGAPKSRAGDRVVVLPRPVAARLVQWLSSGVASDPDALVFAGDKGGPLHRGNFNRRVGWTQNVAAIGAAGLHFHDLRHTGNQLASDSGATPRDLMARMGHDSVRAALVYLHRTQGGDRKIARAMEALFPRDSAAPAGDA
jgi:integrase